MNDLSAGAAAVAQRRTLAGRYELEDVAGTGGAGVVWRARDVLLDRPVAVKLLHAEVARDLPTAAHFRAEAAAAARLTHPNVVVIYDVGRDGDEDYLVMEFVSGGTLAQVLAAGLVAPDVAAGIGVQVASALGAAHARGFVHRDVKPANVLVTAEGIVKVADFGIAGMLGDSATRAGDPRIVLGTARYLAPEQLGNGHVDARADIYALGVVLYEALTGELPFGNGSPEQIAARRLKASLPEVAVRRPDVPDRLSRAVARPTRRDPHDRFPDADAFAAELLVCRTSNAFSTARSLAAVVVAEARAHDDEATAAMTDVGAQ